MKAKLLFSISVLLIVGCGSRYRSWNADEYDVRVGLASAVGEKIVLDTPEKQRLTDLSRSLEKDEIAARRAASREEEKRKAAERLKDEKDAAWKSSIEQRQVQDIDIAYKTGKITKSQSEVMKNQLHISFDHRFERERQEDAQRKAQQAAYERALRQQAADAQRERREAREQEKWRRFGEQLGRALAN